MENIKKSSDKNSTEVVIGGVKFYCCELDSNDGAHLVELHQLVFGKAFTLDILNWKYLSRNSPSLGLWNSDGTLVAHCAGIARQIILRGVSFNGLQICDVVVHPKWRAILTKQGPFFWVSKLFYKLQIGVHCPHQIGYGFPSHRHMRLAEKLNLGCDAGPIWELSWQINSENDIKHPWHWQAIELNEGSAQWQEYIQRAWANMCVASTALSLGDRSSTELDWRYRQHPSHQHFYTALKRPWSRHASGVAIWRYTDTGAILWLDWIGAPSDLARAQRMLAHRHLAAPNSELQTWGSDLIRMALRHTPGYSERLVACIGIPFESNLDFTNLDRNLWWWMAGDTDFL